MEMLGVGKEPAAVADLSATLEKLVQIEALF